MPDEGKRFAAERRVLRAAAANRRCVVREMSPQALVAGIKAIENDEEAAIVQALADSNAARCKALSLWPEQFPGGFVADERIIQRAAEELAAFRNDARPVYTMPENLTRAVRLLEATGLNATIAGATLQAQIFSAYERRYYQQVKKQVEDAGGHTDLQSLNIDREQLKQELEKHGNVGRLAFQTLADLPSLDWAANEEQRERRTRQADCYLETDRPREALKLRELTLHELEASERPGSAEIMKARVSAARTNAVVTKDHTVEASTIEQAIATCEAGHPPPRTELFETQLAWAYKALVNAYYAAGDAEGAKRAEARMRHYAGAKAKLDALVQASSEGSSAPVELAQEFEARQRLLQSSDKEHVLKELRAAERIDALSLMRLFELELERGQYEAAVTALEDAATGFSLVAALILDLGAAHAGTEDDELLSRTSALITNLQTVGSLAAALAVQNILPERTALLAFWLAEKRKAGLFDAHGLSRPKGIEARRQFKLAQARRAQRAHRFFEHRKDGFWDRCEDLSPVNQELLALEPQFAVPSTLDFQLNSVFYAVSAPRKNFRLRPANDFLRRVASRLGETRLVSVFRTSAAANPTKVLLGENVERYVVFVLDGHGDLRFVPLRDAAALERRIKDTMRVVGSRSDKAIAVSAVQALSKELYTPWAAAVGSNSRLILSLDGLSALVPFAALQNDGAWLAADHALSRVQSAFVLTLDIPREGRDLTSPLALIAPQLPEWLRSSDEPKRLLAASREAAALRKLVPDTQVLWADAATEEALREAGTPALLHIASHAYYVPAKPGSNARSNTFAAEAITSPETLWSREGERSFMRSGLVLAGRAGLGEAEGINDGVLSAYEILGMDLRQTQLVVLSACETGRGASADIHGRASLERAFLTAGALSVISSLWPVDDTAAAAWMENFYEGLMSGRSRVDAVKQAYEATRKRWPEPYYWAAFSLLDTMP